jgi:hypothetical protein
MEKVGQIIIPFLFIFCVVSCNDLWLFSSSNNRYDLEKIISNHSQEVFHHDHGEDLQISHEDFFHQSDHSDLSEIFTPEKTHQYINAFPLKISYNFWHPPKLI